jgi:hypothetical protein
MKILMVGKTGVFDTLAVALGYLNQTDIACYSYFGDLATEKARRILEVGEEQGHKVFIVNHKNPRIIMEINHELATLSGLGEQESLQVIPLSILRTWSYHDNFHYLANNLGQIREILKAPGDSRVPSDVYGNK